MQAFFESKGLSKHGYRFTFDGISQNNDHSPGLVAANAVAGLLATHPRAKHFVWEFWNTSISSGRHRCYDGVIYMFSMLHSSGHFRIWAQ
jgi:oligosaccharide reducing-end xylanase